MYRSHQTRFYAIFLSINTRQAQQILSPNGAGYQNPIKV
jgi:hypothetical protein